jgi:hypothetical protein
MKDAMPNPTRWPRRTIAQQIPNPSQKDAEPITTSEFLFCPISERRLRRHTPLVSPVRAAHHHAANP